MQTMQTNYLQYLINDPQYGYLFPHRLALPVFGLQNRHQIDKFRPQLQEGTDFITLPNAQGGRLNLFYTLMGLGKLCDLIQTHQATQFRQELASILQPGNDLSQTPPTAFGALVPMAHSPQDPASVPNYEMYSHPSQMPPDHLQHPHLTPYTPTHQGTSHYNAPSSPPIVSQPVPEPVAQLSTHLQANLAPAVAGQVSRQVQGVIGAIAQNQPSFQEITSTTTAAQDRAVSYYASGVRDAERIQSNTAQIAGDRTFINTETTMHRTETWLDRQDTFAFILIAITICSLLAAGTLAVLQLTSRSRSEPTPQSAFPVESVLNV